VQIPYPVVVYLPHFDLPFQVSPGNVPIYVASDLVAFLGLIKAYPKVTVQTPQTLFVFTLQGLVYTFTMQVL
jgi:hypothetical protein